MSTLGSGDAIEAIEQAFAYGAYIKGYGKYGWYKTGVPTKVAFGALLRHAIKWYTGEDEDDESRHPHTAHMGCNVHFMHEYTYNSGRCIDNRPHKKSCVDVPNAKKDLDGKVHLEDIDWIRLWSLAQSDGGINKINALLRQGCGE
jgi:hypothetical protein